MTEVLDAPLCEPLATPSPSVRVSDSLPHDSAGSQQTVDKRDPYWWRFKKGQSGFPQGRIPGSKNRLSAADIVKRRETRLAKRYVDRATKSDTVLMHVMDKLIPNKSLLASPSSVMLVFVGDGTRPILPGGMLMPAALTGPDEPVSLAHDIPADGSVEPSAVSGAGVSA